MFRDTLAINGLIAILRGLEPARAEAIGATLYETGFRLIEVPLNSPRPFDSIALLRRCLPADCRVGAGTVLEVGQVAQLRDAGGELLVMPHCDPALIRAGCEQGLTVLPGVATPTEAFAALAAGAHGLKLFPAETLGIAALKAWRAVLPAGVPLIPVGGITLSTLGPWLAAGATGFGLGSALFSPDLSDAEVGRRAQAFIDARRALEVPA